MQLTLQEVLKAVGGICLNNEGVGDTLITSIETDSRRIKEGSLFVPIKGERFDGHCFIESLFEEGVKVTLTQEKCIRDARLCMIYVEDTRKALLDLASFCLKKYKIPVIAVTGSVGKTTTKDLIASVLSEKYSVLKTEGNYNNDIGLPLTVFKIEAHHEVAVLEMGMNHFGEIELLSQTASPNFGVITNIGTSHIENLGSREGILKAKTELLAGLNAKGTCFINGDDDLLEQEKHKDSRYQTYGIQSSNDYYAEAIKLGEDEVWAKIISPTHTYSVHIPAPGRHMIYNAIVATAIGEAFNLSAQEIQKGFENYTPTSMRMTKITCKNGLRIIDDTYNASPDSMKAALSVLAGHKVQGKKSAVLGDMFEMGTHSQRLHEEVGKYAAEIGIDALYCVGKLAYHIYEGAKQKLSSNMECQYFEDQEAFLKQYDGFINKTDMILFKASRGMHFEKLVHEVRKVNDNE